MRACILRTILLPIFDCGSKKTISNGVVLIFFTHFLTGPPSHKFTDLFPNFTQAPILVQALASNSGCSVHDS